MSGAWKAFWREDDAEAARLLLYDTFAEYKAAGGKYAYNSGWSRARREAFGGVRAMYPRKLASGFWAQHKGDEAYDRRVCEAFPEA